MTAREQLEQIKILDGVIRRKVKERRKLWDMATKTTAAMNYEVIQSNKISDRVGEGAGEISDIDTEIKTLRHERKKIVDLIELLDNPLQCDVLYEFYVEHKKLTAVAKELKYSYYYIVEVHKEALKNLDLRIKNL